MATTGTIGICATIAGFPLTRPTHASIYGVSDKGKGSKQRTRRRSYKGGRVWMSQPVGGAYSLIWIPPH